MFALLAAASVLTLDTPSSPSPYFLDQSTVMQVVCPIEKDGMKGSWTGSAFYIGNGRFVTARHVIRDEDDPAKPLLTTCTIKDQPVTILDVGKGSVDYAMIQAAVWLPYRAILSCNGVKQGRSYYATGYAMGNPWQVTTRLIGSGSKVYSPGPGNNEESLRGRAVQGMSGGPVGDDDGVIVGIMSAGADYGIPETIILSLADTPLCKKA